MIHTVLGPIADDELGFCLPHEHIWCDQALAPRAQLFGTLRNTNTQMRLDHFGHMLEELKAYHDAGGRSIVEVTCDGWGRDVETLARLSTESQVHVIATAGFYIEPCLPPIVADWSVEKLADHISWEIEKGVNGTQHRCGVLKSAIHRARVEGLELKGLKAVAIAQRRTGVAITSHTTGGRRQEVPGGNVGLQQLKILKSEGVSPERFIVGHVDERPDITVLSQLASEGCFIQFDLIGKEHWLLDQTRVDLLGELVRRGFVRHLLLSHDRNRHHEMRYGGGSGYCHILENFLSRLRQTGLSDNDIQLMTVANPARAFALS